MTTQQPEALRLADAIEKYRSIYCKEAAAELRRLHEVEERLLAARDDYVEGHRKLAAINAQLLGALDEMRAEFRALDLPYGSKAYNKARAAIAAASDETSK